MDIVFGSSGFIGGTHIQASCFKDRKRNVIGIYNTRRKFISKKIIIK